MSQSDLSKKSLEFSKTLVPLYLQYCSYDGLLILVYNNLKYVESLSIDVYSII